MSAPGMHPVETQPERTFLAWQRTFIAFIVVVGVGGLRVLATGHDIFILASVLLCAMAAVPMALRQRQLRRHDFTPLSWQPVVLLACVLLFAAAGLLAIAHGGQA